MMRNWGGPRGFAGRFSTRFRSLRERPLEGRHFRATIVLVAGLALAAAGFAALGPSLGAFTAQVSSQAEVGAGSLDLALNPPSPASSPTNCTANAGNNFFAANCNGAYVTTTAAAPSQVNAADWLASSSGTITPQNDPGFSFTLTSTSSCSADPSTSTICSDTEATVDELAAQPNVATPSPGYSYQYNTLSYDLFGVSCPSTTVCVAVGPTVLTSANSDSDGVVVTSNDGGVTWSPVTYVTGPLAGTTDANLNSVSCPSATSCVAVGGVQTSSGSDTGLSLEGTFASGSWTWTPTTFSSMSTFLSVSCLAGTTDDCVAVGRSSSNSFVASTTSDGGSTWTPPQTLNAQPTDPVFTNILSCTGTASAATCAAVWNANPSTSTSTAEAYVGTIPSGGTGLGSLTWSAATTFPTAGDVLAGVACPSTTSCVVVGSNSGSSPTAGVADTLSIASGSGTWGTPTTPSGTADLDGVACTSSTDCTAVGYWLLTSGTNTYEYDATTVTSDGGSTWSSADQFPDYGAANYSDFLGLNAVACGSTTTSTTTSTECSAVGDYGSATSTNSGQSWVGYEPLECVFPPPPPSSNSNSNSNTTCTFSSDTLANLESASPLPLQPSTVADPGVIIEVSTELASSSTSDEGATATVPLTFTVSS